MSGSSRDLSQLHCILTLSEFGKSVVKPNSKMSDEEKKGPQHPMKIQETGLTCQHHDKIKKTSLRILDTNVLGILAKSHCALLILQMLRADWRERIFEETFPTMNNPWGPMKLGYDDLLMSNGAFIRPLSLFKYLQIRPFARKIKMKNSSVLRS